VAAGTRRGRGGRTALPCTRPATRGDVKGLSH
jgi:hypothetical protein